MSGPPRLHHAGPITAGATIDLPGAAQRHVQALRLAAGDAIRLFNGDGYEYDAQLGEVTRRGVRARVRSATATDRESPLRIVLVQAVAAGDRMDMVVQKATELGVAAIHCVITNRSIVRLSADRQARRAEHWQNVTIAACEQCGRNRVPTVHPAIGWADWLARPMPQGIRLVLDPTRGRPLRAFTPAPHDEIRLLVGPESGLTDDELRDASRFGFEAVRFGPRVLRTETAPLAAIAAMQAIWGDC